MIASEIPGKSDREKTINAYILTGVGHFLATGSTDFADSAARKTCTDAGCYGKGNHATYLKAKGSSFTGTKDSGWKLTSPGLKAGADLIKGITKVAND